MECLKSRCKLLGSDVSCHTGKVKAYLKYQAINFEEVLASTKVHKEQIIPETGVRHISVPATPDSQYIQDTTDLIDHPESKYPKGTVYPASPRRRLVALLFKLFGDEWLKIPAMYYRWWPKEENYEFIIREFSKAVLF